MPPENITTHFDNYCSYVLNITSFLFPSDVIRVGYRLNFIDFDSAYRFFSIPSFDSNVIR